MKRLTLALMFVASIASANEVAIYGGPSIVSLNHETDGTVTNQQGHRASVGGQLLFDVVPGFMLGLDVMHNGLTSLDGDGSVIETLNGVEFNRIPTHSHQDYDTNILLLTAKILPDETEWYHPYLSINAGVHRTHLKESQTITGLDTYGNTRTWDGVNNNLTIVDQTKTGVAMGFSTGVDIPTSKTTFVGAEFRYLYLGRAQYDVTPQARATGLAPSEEALSGMSIVNVLLKAGVKF
jgi:opacity protein-like surface antigen